MPPTNQEPEPPHAPTPIDYQHRTRWPFIWGYFACSVPTMAIASGISFVFVSNLFHLTEREADHLAGRFIISGWLIGSCLSIAALLLDKQKRQYAYIALAINALLAFLLFNH